MPKITTFSEANKFLMQYVRGVNEPGGYKLDRIRAVMEFLDNPQDSYKVIHVAGTSGKTSTCYYIAAMLKAAGYKVGHTVSPHVDTISERAQVDLSVLPEDIYCAKLSEFISRLEPSHIKLSYFELLVAFAYWLFASQKVDYAVVEVGLGGLLDGTNVVSRNDKVCVITDIGYDHTEILGNTLAEIATQKAGIIHTKNPVFMYRQSNEVVSVVDDACHTASASLHIVDKPIVSEYISKLPLFQQRNWYLASVVAKYVLINDRHAPLSEVGWRETIETYIPARMERVVYKDKVIIIDGSHNEQKIGALVESIKNEYKDSTILQLVSFGENKSVSVRSASRNLRILGDTIVFTEFARGQDEMRVSMKMSEMSAIAKSVGFKTVIEKNTPLAALKYCMDQPFDILLITGSFYLLNYIRPLLFNNFLER